MSPTNSKRKATPENQSIKVVIPSRPDLDRFKPANGKIFDTFKTDPSDQKLEEPVKSKTTSKKKDPELPESSSSKKIKSNHSSPIQAVERKPKKAHLSKSSKSAKTSKPAAVKKKRPSKNESPDPDEDSDIGDIVLSDYEEPETKLREREPVERKRFAKLRKLRKQLKKKKSINKEVNSKRIVPDSDVEVEGAPSKSATKPEKSHDDDDDDDDSEEESENGSSSEDGSSETDEEERERKQEEFIVDDLATVAQKNRAQRRIDTYMPVMFRSGKLDNRTHFMVVCEYLIHHIILPQIDWRQCREDYDQSCKHLETYFHSYGVQPLESSGWTLKFRTQLMSRPYIYEQYNHQGGKGCGACRNRTKFSRKILLLAGIPYNPYNLNPIKPKRSSESGSETGNEDEDEEDDDEWDSEIEEDEGKQHKFKLDPDLMHITKKSARLISGEDCAKRAMEYHFFKHWKMHLLKKLKKLIKPLREQTPALKKNYRYSDPKPSPDRLRLMKREIRGLCQSVEADKTLSNLDNLYNHFISRLNKIRQTYVNAG
ncbi:hypothetical protein PGTUg99_014776 [Puccinia graminis f. sp. tritici]|uniref:DUF4211 domain-containing protein n=2 Tax=Puccinia graminis f. sp. tritici TaxID=56615 RepID=A0A5B0PVK1_PUCGR|nr:hypothetical protein PGTUg99_014776 [Puccinia graminis f. sp. tritici]